MLAKVGIAAAFDGPQVGECCGQLGGTVDSAVRDEQLGGVRLQQGLKNAARGTASAQHQHALVGQRQPEIFFQVLTQAHAIGVGAEQAAIVAHHQGIHGAGALRFRAQHIRHFKRRLLVRHGDVGTGTPFSEEPACRSDEFRGRHIHQPVRHVLPELLGEQTVDERRLALRHGVTEEHIAVGGVAGGRHLLASSFNQRATLGAK